MERCAVRTERRWTARGDRSLRRISARPDELPSRRPPRPRSRIASTIVPSRDRPRRNRGDHALEFVRQLAPEEGATENVETSTDGLGGALAGGLGGAVSDPAGIVAGMTAEALFGGFIRQGSDRELKRRMNVRCRNCGYRGRADGGPAESGDRPPATYSTGISTSAIPPPIAASKASRSSAGDSGR